MKRTFLLISAIAFSAAISFAQIDTQILKNIEKEAMESSQLEQLGMELMDDIGARLIGTPQYSQASQWVVDKYKSWGITAERQKYGTWRAWERGETYASMTYPRPQQLQVMQLSWSPATPRQNFIEAEVMILPDVADEAAFKKWLPKVKGKIVLIAKPETSGRPVENWEKNALAVDFESFQQRKSEVDQAWFDKMDKYKTNFKLLQKQLEEAGAIALVSSNWTGGWVTNRIMANHTQKIPHVDMRLEDYQMLYRFCERGIQPKIKLKVTSKELGRTDVHNAIGTIKSTINPEEYVMLSAHLDSWDGGTGATDNGTGTILMMEVMRILKQHYPNPKRNIIVGHWGGEEQGLIGSRAFVEDNEDLMPKISVLFNQDNGTGRIAWINALGYLDAYKYFNHWFKYLPAENRESIKTDFPGNPGGRGSSDYYSFLSHDVPAFFLISHSWDYGTYTWHTHTDTYDKIAWEDIKRNAVTIATFVYLACEEPEMFSRRKAELPVNIKTGEQMEWPKGWEANRDGKSYFEVE